MKDWKRRLSGMQATNTKTKTKNEKRLSGIEGHRDYEHRVVSRDAGVGKRGIGSRCRTHFAPTSTADFAVPRHLAAGNIAGSITGSIARENCWRHRQEHRREHRREHRLGAAGAPKRLKRG